jgi:hypothetical protein
MIYTETRHSSARPHVAAVASTLECDACVKLFTSLQATALLCAAQLSEHIRLVEAHASSNGYQPITVRAVHSLSI